MAVKLPGDFREFAMLHPDAEAVIQRVGLNTFDCVLIDVEGNWTRAVFPSKGRMTIGVNLGSPSG
jgi:hypothetical protein